MRKMFTVEKNNERHLEEENEIKVEMHLNLSQRATWTMSVEELRKLEQAIQKARAEGVFE